MSVRGRRSSVAFDLGTCNGRYMYAAVEWYFAQHGQTFDPNRFEDVCIGSYYPLQDGPYQPGATFTGTWQTLGLTLTHCSSYLRSATTTNPSCSFDWS